MKLKAAFCQNSINAMETLKGNVSKYAASQ